MTPRSFFSGLWRGLDGLRKVLHLIVLLAIFAVLVGVLRAGVPRIPARAALLIAPQGELVEQLSGDPVTRALEEARGEGHAETLLWDLSDSIHAAASDRRIPAVALDLEKFAGATQVTLEELAGALREFRASGKKVIAYGTEFTQERYSLAAQADEIYLDPMGFVLLDGYDRYRTYLKDALDKLGVDINVFRVGAFKSAVETYTRTSMSPEDREESRSYLNALWSSYQQAVTLARKLPADALTKYVATLAKTVPAGGGYGLRKRSDVLRQRIGRQLARVGHGLLVAAPERVEIAAALLAVLGRHAGTRIGLDGALEGTDAEHVDVHAELVERVLQVRAVAVVAVEQHEAHRIEVDLVGLGGEVVALLGELRAVGDHFLAAGAEFAQCAGQLFERDLGRACEFLQIQRHGRNTPVARRRVDRVGQIPQQCLRVTLPTCLLDRARHRGARELLDQLPLGSDEQRRPRRDPRHAGAQRPYQHGKDRQQHDQMQRLAQAVQAA